MIGNNVLKRPPAPVNRPRGRVYWLWVAYSLALLAGSALPGASVPSVALLGWDKLAHGVAFALLAALTAAASRGQRRWPWWVVTYGAIMGLVTEGVQAFVPGREASLYDWMADLVGLVALLFVILICARSVRPAGKTTSAPTEKMAAEAAAPVREA